MRRSFREFAAFSFCRKTSETGIFVSKYKKKKKRPVSMQAVLYGNRPVRLDRFELDLWLPQLVFVFLRIETYRIPQLEWTVSRNTTMGLWLALISNIPDVPMPISEEGSTTLVSETGRVWKKFVWFSSYVRSIIICLKVIDWK